MFIEALSKIMIMVITSTLMTFCIDVFSENHIGNLGDIPVDLPKSLVHLVEYDGDPAWGKKREGSKPTRSYDSKVNSVGFDMRYTDNTIFDESSEEIKRAYDEQKNLGDSPWISVCVSSGDRYHGVGATHRIGNGTISASNVHPTYRYAKLDNNQYGLEVYAPPGIDPKTNKRWREDSSAKDVFIQRDKKGQIITYIECSNRNVPRPPCSHNFDIEPQMGLYVNVHYSSHNLADWQQIEQVVRLQILNFRKTS